MLTYEELGLFPMVRGYPADVEYSMTEDMYTKPKWIYYEGELFLVLEKTNIASGWFSGPMIALKLKNTDSGYLADLQLSQTEYWRAESEAGPHAREHYILATDNWSTII